MTLDDWIAGREDRCGHGFHVTQRPYLCSCAGIARRTTVLAAVNDHADPDDKTRIDQAIARMAATGREFSANDVRDQFGGVTGSVVGARFNSASRRGLIRDTGKRVPSTLASTNAHEVRVWVGATSARKAA